MAEFYGGGPASGGAGGGEASAPRASGAGGPAGQSPPAGAAADGAPNPSGPAAPLAEVPYDLGHGLDGAPAVPRPESPRAGRLRGWLREGRTRLVPRTGAHAPGGGEPRPAAGGRRRGTTATSWAAALVLAFAVGLWAGGAAFTPPPALPAAASGTATPTPVRIVRSVPTTARAIALTFDDGPSPKYTPMVLQLLQQYGAHATFFVIGQEVERYPQILKQEVDAGEEIGNHGYHHLTLKSVSTAQLLGEVQTAEQTLVSLTGSDPTLYRLPGGKSDPAALRQLADLGYKIVMWSIDTRDYLYRPPSAIVAQVEKEVAPGAIVIFHDGGGNQQHTVDALKTLLPWLKEQGYQMMTVSQLLAMPRAAVTR